MKLKETSSPLVLGIFLALVGAIAALILAMSDNVTREPIKANSRKNMVKALRDVLPPFANQPDEQLVTFESDDKVEVKFYAGKDESGKITGIAAETVSGKGYAGKIKVMTGFFPDGKVRSVLVTEQNETPGLGTVVCQRKNVVKLGDLVNGKKAEAGLPKNPILDQFSGHSAAPDDTWKRPWAVKKDGGTVDYMTGATITSRAVTEAVDRAAATLLAQRNEIMRNFSNGSK